MAKKPLISTVVLNWNRSHLLEQTLASYMDTVSCAHELYIVDNASSDNSREIIERFVREYPDTKVLFLPKNIGGEAYNEALPHLKGELIYLVENDQIHLPGWCEKTLHAFQSYPWLGQFSLHAPVPTDAEAWVTKPVQIRFKNSCLVYQLHTNVTTSCILRRALIEKGLRVHNIPNPNSDIKLPDDGRLGGEVKSMGYWIAYSDHYYVRNIGHEAEEIENNPDYYQPNYAAKAMVGVKELQKRLDQQKELRKVYRKSLLFPQEPILGELAPQGVKDMPARMWSMFDSRTPEVEIVEFIYTLARLMKPQRALETSGWRGIATSAISTALLANGFGTLTSLEDDVNAYAYLAERVQQLRLTNVRVRNDKSERFGTEDQYDFVLFNSTYEDQEEEFFHILPFLKDGATLVFTGDRHDAHAINSRPRTYERLGLLHGQHFATPRGIYVGTYKKYTPPSKRRIIFGLSSGRSGTAYLTSLLKGLPGLIALHEPEPKYQWQSLGLQQNPQLAHEFVTGPKKHWVDRLPDATYFEASHYLAKGFMEAWVKAGVIPDTVIMERDLRKTALSWYSLNVDFFQNPSYVLQHMLHPQDHRQLFLPLVDWKSLNNYQLCYWYALESRKRSEHYAQYLEAKGARSMRTSLERLTSGQDTETLLKWLGIETDKGIMAIMKERLAQRVNDKNQFKNSNRLKSITSMDLDSLEAAVLKQCGL